MFNKHKKEITWGGRPLIIETGQIARQAGGAVMVTYGETSVFTAVTAAKKRKQGSIFSRSQLIIKKKLTLLVKYQGDFLSVKHVLASQKF